MTLDRAIRIAQAWANGRVCTLRDEEVEEYHKLAFAALRAQAEAERNDPLTLEELREMDGEPVWVCDPTDVKLGSWSFIDLEYDMCVATAGGLTLFEKYGKTWLAYCRKPETGTS